MLMGCPSDKVHDGRSAVSHGRKLRLAGLLVLLLALLAGYAQYRPAAPPVDVQSLLVHARRQLQERNLDAVEQDLEVLLAQPQVPPAAWLIAGELSFHRGNLEQALAHFQKLPQDGSRLARDALLGQADIHFGRQDYARAEKLFLQLLDVDPTLLLAHERLSFMYNIQGRRLESVPHLMSIIHSGAFDVGDLCMLSNMQAVFVIDEEDAEGSERLQQQPSVQVGLARRAMESGDLDRARELLESAVAGAPDLLEAQVWMGRVHVLSRNEPAYAHWHSALPSAAEQHPEIWLSRALRELHHQRFDSALRCLWEGLRIDPNFATLADHFVDTLVRTGQTELAADISPWKQNLTELAIISQLVFDEPGAFQAHRAADAARMTEEMGRLWEACAWSQVASEMNPNRLDAVERLRRLVPHLKPDLPRNLAERNPFEALDLSHLPLPPAVSPSQEPSAALTSADADLLPTWSRPHEVRFSDEAQQRGLLARYFFSEDPSTDGGRMFEFTGGGTAALDFDRDGLVDFYFTQGTQWPPDPANLDHLDWLFRQSPDNTFVEVTAEARIVENSFSQGVAIGDWNQDGFQDAYVANIGRNRLFVNQGDGTFIDATDEAGIDSHLWTTSVLMGDLNGDGLPDLFDVNYVHDDDVYERICEREGEPGSCAPIAFYPLQDEVFLNTGNGGVQPATEASGLARQQGNGLGILMFRLPGSPHPRLLIANDMGANHFYTAEPNAGAGEVPTLVESAALRGLAYSDDGKAQACMGIALGDVENDGQWDLFITNFEHEYNTLYRPYAEGYYRDDTRAAGLSTLSLPMVGFGTQFIDADLDGFADLFIFNGHVDEIIRAVPNYHQPPQVLYNLAGQSFRDLPAEQLGPDFRARSRGRSLVRTDWNRDGRIDVAGSCLDAPVVLFTNVTSTDSHFVTLRFVATTGDREALTTICRVQTASGTQVGQLTAGDGYQSSNERIVHFGLGPDTRIERLEVEWPDGNTTILSDLDVDCCWMIRQGDNRAYRLDTSPDSEEL
jgi:tetratricopeptide (TPR) repeat protein